MDVMGTLSVKLEDVAAAVSGLSGQDQEKFWILYAKFMKERRVTSIAQFGPVPGNTEAQAIASIKRQVERALQEVPWQDIR